MFAILSCLSAITLFTGIEKIWLLNQLQSMGSNDSDGGNEEECAIDTISNQIAAGDGLCSTQTAMFAASATTRDKISNSANHDCLWLPSNPQC